MWTFKNLFRNTESLKETAKLTTGNVNEEVDLHLVNIMGHGHLNMGSYSDDVDVHLWLPEMNGVNVTMLCDRLVDKGNETDGFIFLITDKSDINCLSVLNIEDQSSGFEIYKQESNENNDILIMKVSPNKIKKELKIPDDCWSGYVWGNHLSDCPIPSHGVPTSKFNCKYILNFSVSGEFNLEVYYVPKGEGKPVWLLKKSFCCK